MGALNIMPIGIPLAETASGSEMAGSPVIGHLDPTADYDQIISRLVDWVAFTPLQNVTGDPAISLPLACPPPAGLPIGMMFSAPIGGEATLLGLAYELEAASAFLFDRRWPTSSRTRVRQGLRRIPRRNPLGC